jgi:hypothetical protein
MQADKLVFAFGSNDNSNLFKQFGLDLVPYKRSLVSLKTSKNKGLDGVRVSDVEVSLEFVDKRDKIQRFKEVGEVLFKTDGISGIVVFDLSARLARAGVEKGRIHIDFLPNISEEKLFNKLIERQNFLKAYLVEDFLTGFFHKEINKNLIERAKLVGGKKVADLTQKELELLVKIIKNYEIEVAGISENNQVWSGGVDLNCLNGNLESKKTPNLYCIGELVDVDGVCGGYNLQWAWTSGQVVGIDL